MAEYTKIWCETCEEVIYLLDKRLLGDRASLADFKPVAGQQPMSPDATCCFCGATVFFGEGRELAVRRASRV